MARDQYEAGDADEFVQGEGAGRVVVDGEPADQVVPGVGELAQRQLDEVFGHLDEGGLGDGRVLLRHGDAGLLDEERGVLLRDTQ
ncbi:hypothetical protein [Streptomyces sp. NPDC001165]|uniref:hypothetical protein n=1 Tax=Streptomyces sp. NPDC001165 TaxID=3364546 RepID=UPI0036C19271